MVSTNVMTDTQTHETQIFASKYKTILPSEIELAAMIDQDELGY